MTTFFREGVTIFFRFRLTTRFHLRFAFLQAIIFAKVTFFFC
jgi:hypothetical protein